MFFTTSVRGTFTVPGWSQVHIVKLRIKATIEPDKHGSNL